MEFVTAFPVRARSHLRAVRHDCGAQCRMYAHKRCTLPTPAVASIGEENLCFPWDVFPARKIVVSARKLHPSRAECASRVPADLFSAGPREAVQAPYRAGYTAG